jgi:hypothetical protein
MNEESESALLKEIEKLQKQNKFVYEYVNKHAQFCQHVFNIRSHGRVLNVQVLSEVVGMQC